MPGKLKTMDSEGEHEMTTKKKINEDDWRNCENIHTFRHTQNNQIFFRMQQTPEPLGS